MKAALGAPDAPQATTPLPGPKQRVLICTPLKDVDTLGAGHPYFRQTLEDIAKLRSSDYEFNFATMEGGICHVRNAMAHKAKEMGVDWLVFWDFDIQPANGVEALLRLLSWRLPIVGAAYTVRTNKNTHWVANFMHEVALQKDALLQVIELGTGMKAYRVSVFHHLDKMFPTIAYTDRDTGARMGGYFQQGVYVTDLCPDGTWLTEDFFCDWLCRIAGVGIWLDTGLKVKHRGPDGTLYPDKWPPIPGVS